VICEPTRSKWWGTGRRSPRGAQAGAPRVSKTGYRYPSVASDMLTQAQWAWERGRAPRGGQCAKDCATAPREKINFILAVARAGGGQTRAERGPRRTWCPVGTKKRKRKAGSELGWGFGVKSPIGLRSSEGIGRTESSPTRLSSYILPSLAAIDPSQIGFLRRGGTLSEWG